MQQTPGQSRTVSPVPSLFNLQLEHYLLAAAAAGVSIIALAQPADAEVVYKPAHVVLTYGHTYSLDVNGDSIPDFLLSDLLVNSSSGHAFLLTVHAQAAGNFVVGFPTEDRFIDAAALMNGAPIAPATGETSALLAAFSTAIGGGHYLYGRWPNTKNHYLGLSFKINGQTHFGWARLNVLTNTNNDTAYLTGYAYETIPGKGIVAGQATGTADDAKLNPQPSNEDQPASLGKLALGAAKPGAVIPTEKAE
jgi:hypothetical protein